MRLAIPENRLRTSNSHPLKTDGQWVLYWMTAFRRTRYNFALQHAAHLAQEMGKPLVILEALRVRYRWACDRFHRFIIEGMVDNQQACSRHAVHYFPYVEPQAGDGSGLVKTLARDACAVVTDDFPCFFHPAMISRLSKQVSVRVDAVDSNAIMPLAHAERTFTVAHSYRRWMQKELPFFLEDMPMESPLASAELANLPELPAEICRRWPAANLKQLLAPGGLQHLAIDHNVAPAGQHGGSVAADRGLNRFISDRLDDYDEARNEPDEYGSSELSPYLHFGHLAPHEMFLHTMDREQWNPSKIQKPNGKVNGFWGVSETAEAFLDQLCTWREIGFNMCWREREYRRFASLPDWAQKTLADHQADKRDYVYSREEFESASTHDPIWNAAQRQLVREGRIHNYLRMLWGKKILHWSETPQHALRVMIELNNKYALDGRNPNSYSGIFWVLGRYDRAWGPERPIFGKVRYMTSENTAKKHRLREYLKRYAD